MARSGAFLGISLDSSVFSRAFIAFAVPHLLRHHETLLLLLGDELMLYTRSQSVSETGPTLCIAQSTARAHKRADELARFLERECRRLGINSTKVRICRWLELADSHYSMLLRRLQIALASLPSFRAFVEAEASRHVLLPPTPNAGVDRLALNSLYVLDEAAMALRVTELGGYPHEYYPGPDIPLLQALYGGVFRGVGLTVDSLVGHGPLRTFETIVASQPHPPSTGEGCR